MSSKQQQMLRTGEVCIRMYVSWPVTVTVRMNFPTRQYTADNEVRVAYWLLYTADNFSNAANHGPLILLMMHAVLVRVACGFNLRMSGMKLLGPFSEFAHGADTFGSKQSCHYKPSATLRNGR